jgi:hypothetical protein
MNPGMVATAMLAAAEQRTGPFDLGKTLVGQLGQGKKITLVVHADGKRTLEFTGASNA